MSTRRNVLTAIYQTLESSESLCTLVGHTAGATSIQGGARILGDSVRIEGIPDTMLILSFSDEPSASPPRGTSVWNIEVWIYAPDIFLHADILDALQAMCDNFTCTPDLPATINKLGWGGHQRVTPQDIPTRLITTRVVLQATFI